MRWFYREHRVVGHGRVPESGPVLLVGNHPNDIPDVIAGLYLSPRHPRYIATVSVTTNPIAKAMYDAMAVIPIARVRDARKMKAEGVDIAAINQAATDTVLASLAAGDVVEVFPEGGVHDGPGIGKFRSGVAKMVLAHLDAGADNDVIIAPFGHQYEAPRRWGSDLLSVLGEPFSARAWLAAQPVEGRGPAALTEALRAAVLQVTRNSATRDEAVTRDMIVAAAAGVSAPRNALAAAPRFAAAAAPTAAEAHGDGPGAAAVRVKTAAHALAHAVEEAGGIGTSSVDMACLLFALDVHKAAAPVPTIVLWMGLPAAAIGWVLNGPILPVVYLLAKRATKEPSDFVAACFVPGLYVVLLWWVLVALAAGSVLTAVGWSPLWAVLLLVSLPRFGDLAMGWKEWLRAWRLVARVHKWSTPKRRELREAAAIIRAWAAG